MATFDEYMAAAGRAHAAGDTDAARRLVQAAMRARAEPVAPPSVPETPTVPEPPSEPVAEPVAPPVDAPTFEVGEARVVQTEADLPRELLPTDPARFAPVEETEQRLADLVDARVQAALEARGELVDDPTAFEAATRRRAEEDVARQRERMVIAGREDEPVEPTAFLPMGRPTRIAERRVRAQADEEFAGFLTEQVERLYRDPDTGDLRPPTAGEELVETFAAQPVMTEAEARAADDALRKQKADIQARREAGEEVSVWERASPYVTEAFNYAMQTPGETGGVYESATAATLRSVPAFLSAALREGYFGGLGFDVDEDGRPIDVTDFGYQVAKARESVGLKPVESPFVLVTTPGRLAVEAVYGEEAGARVRRAAEALPYPVPVVLPGVAVEATRRRNQVETDPEARRQRPDVDVPSLLDNPAGWFDAEARRIARTIQADRGLGDDLVDAPEVRAAYADLYGNPDAAWWAGTLGDVFIPAGPGTAFRNAAKATSALGKAASETKAARSLTSALVQRAGEVRELPSTATRAERALITAMADAAAVVVPGRASDGRVVRKIADNVVDITPGLTDTERAAMKGAIRQGSDTPAEVVRDMARAIDKPPTDPDVQRLLTEIELRTPDDLVMVSEAVAVPRAIAPQARRVMGQAVRRLQEARTPGEQASVLRSYDMPAYAKRVEEAGGLAELEPRVQNVLREQVKTMAAYRAAPEISRAVRKADTVSEFNAYVNRLVELRPSVTTAAYGPLVRRLAAVYGSKAYAVVPASVAKATKALRAAGAAATRDVANALKAEARTARTAEDALDRVFARELGELSSDALYGRILGEMYGGELVPSLMRNLKQDDLVLGGRLLTDTPTAATLRRIDEHAIANGYVRAHGPAPEIDRAMLRAVLEEGVRKRVALGGKEFEAALVATGQRAAKADSGIGGYFRVPDRLDPQAGAPGSRLRQYRLKVDPQTEGRLIEGVDELVRVLGNEPGLGRFGWGEWYAQKTGRILQNVRDAEYAMRYGYYLPNVPYLVGRAVALPIVSLATIGAENTLRSLARAAGRAVPDGPLYPRSRRMGLGVTDPEGVYYAPKVLDDLLEVHGGLGTTAIQQARSGRLARDMLRDAQRNAAGPARRLLFDASARPDVVNFYMKTAEAVELSYRRSVFEAAIAHGLQPSDAALLARKSLFDYSEVPDALTNTLGALLADAGEMYMQIVEFGRLVARNPEQISRIAKATRARQKAQDRYGLEGDRTLKSLGIVPAGRPGAEVAVYGPDSPHLRPVEKTLDLLRSADFIVQRLLGVYRRTGRADYSGALNTLREGAGELVRYGASELFPGVLDAFEATAGAELGRATATGRDLSTFDDRTAFWAALLAADYADPRHDDGTWNTVVDLLDPELVKPPEGLAVPNEPDVWAAQPPEGTPFIALGETVDGIPRYQVFKPSERGLRNLRAIRALPLRTLEQAFGVGASLYGSSDNVDVEALFPQGAAGAIGRLLGGRAVPSRDEEVQRARQTEAIRAVREDVR